MVRPVLLLLALAACSGTSTPPTTGPTTDPTTDPTTGPTSATGSAATGGAAVGTAPTSSGSAATSPGVRVTLADVGLETSSLDRTADPCVDFYQFACGGWLANNKIPADRARWARFSELDEKNTAATRLLLEEAAKGTGGDAASKQLGDYYASCMDEAAIERAGTASIKPVLARTTKLKNAKAWMAALTELHRAGNWVVWSVDAAADLKDSVNNVTHLDAAGLGLPDRDYYLKPELAEARAAYRGHVARMLGLLAPPGTPPARTDAAAADVIAIETAIAKLTKTATEKRDVPAAYNPTELKALGKQARSVDWKTYWKTLGIKPSKKLIVGTPRFFAGLDRLRRQFKPAQWSSYFSYHLARGMAFALPKAFEQEAFALEQVLTGVEQQQDRSKRCIEATQRALGELLGQQYVAKHFPASAKQTASLLVDALVRTMGEEIGRLDWMTPATKTIAQGKLAKIVRMIGYPDKWRTYDFAVKRDDFAGNALRAATFETRRDLAKSGTPVDRGEWQMNAYTVNAYYEPTANNTALPAGILQPPFFGEDRSVAANLGGIGMVIGHELTHGFDDQGAQFDADGNLVNWWQKDDAAKFADKAKCVAEQYGTFEALPKSYVNGQLTLGENIADLGGVKMAFKAYRSLRKDAPKIYVADGYTEDQQFFIAVGQAWCNKDRAAEIQRRLTVDPHAPPKFRVYGSLRNLKEFSEAFSCAAGTPMNPAKSCSVW